VQHTLNFPNIDNSLGTSLPVIVRPRSKFETRVCKKVIMSEALLSAIDVIDDLLAKVDTWEAAGGSAASAAPQVDAQPAQKGKKKDKKAKKEQTASDSNNVAASNEQSSDPFALADLRVCSCAACNDTNGQHEPEPQSTMLTA
jgi:hypothetical protein